MIPCMDEGERDERWGIDTFGCNGVVTQLKCNMTMTALIGWEWVWHWLANGATQQLDKICWP